jgi:hypothetical protein
MHLRSYLISLSSLAIVACIDAAFVAANWYDYRTVFGGRNEIEHAVADGWQPMPGTVNASGVSFYYRRPHLAIGQLFQGASIDSAPPRASVSPVTPQAQLLAACPNWTSASSKSINDPC